MAQRRLDSYRVLLYGEALPDEIAQGAGADPITWRMQQFGTKHLRHAAALQFAMDKSGYGKREPPAVRVWGVAMHESSDSGVAFVVKVSVQDNQTRPVPHQVATGVHGNFAVNPMSIEAQVQGGALMGLSMCLPGAVITLKADGVWCNRAISATPRCRASPRCPQSPCTSCRARRRPPAMGRPGLPPLAPALANVIAKPTGKRLRVLPFDLA